MGAPNKETLVIRYFLSRSPNGMRSTFFIYIWKVWINGRCDMVSHYPMRDSKTEKWRVTLIPPPRRRLWRFFEFFVCVWSRLAGVVSNASSAVQIVPLFVRVTVRNKTSATKTKQIAIHRRVDHPPAKRGRRRGRQLGLGVTRSRPRPRTRRGTRQTRDESFPSFCLFLPQNHIPCRTVPYRVDTDNDRY